MFLRMSTWTFKTAYSRSSFSSLIFLSLFVILHRRLEDEFVAADLFVLDLASFDPDPFDEALAEERFGLHLEDLVFERRRAAVDDQYFHDSCNSFLCAERCPAVVRIGIAVAVENQVPEVHGADVESKRRPEGARIR